MNAEDKGNILGERFRGNGRFESIFASQQELEGIRTSLKPYLESLGLTTNDVYLDRTGKVVVRMPVLRKAEVRYDSKTTSEKESVSEDNAVLQKAGETENLSYEERALRDAKKQILLNGLNKASETILNESHNITANGIAHAFKNHGVKAIS